MRTLWLCVGLMLFSLSANGAVDPLCPLKGIKPTPAQLKTILANHRKWVDKKKEKIKNYKLTIEEFEDAFTQKQALPANVLAQMNALRANHIDKWLLKNNKGKSKNYKLTIEDFKDPLYANLCGANLTGPDLRGANLTVAYLGHANLTRDGEVGTA